MLSWFQFSSVSESEVVLYAVSAAHTTRRLQKECAPARQLRRRSHRFLSNQKRLAWECGDETARENGVEGKEKFKGIENQMNFALIAAK